MTYSIRVYIWGFMMYLKMQGKAVDIGVWGGDVGER